MRLAQYDFTLKHRAGRLHNNADGLSRARSAPSPDTPSDHVIGVEIVQPQPPNTELLLAALEAFEADANVDG